MSLRPSIGTLFARSSHTTIKFGKIYLEIKTMVTKQSRRIPDDVADTPTQAIGEGMVIPVIQEELIVNKQLIETGKVRISKRVTEHEEVVDLPIFREEVSVERVPINKVVDALPPVRKEGDTMIIPVVQEQIVVHKTLLLVEELRVRKEVIESHQSQTIILRKEEVNIQRTAENMKPARPTRTQRS
jgi:uncharacterized protein (TIGR02271 family)